MFIEDNKEHKIEFASIQPQLQVVNLCTGRQDLRCAQEKGAQTIPFPQGNAETKLSLGYL